MFVQIIEGRVADREAFRRQFQRWLTELRPGATGYLGSTGGVTADGRCFLTARFEDEAAARANSERREQGDWWAETEKCFDGPVTFTESSDVASLLAGGSDQAGFVQVVKSDDIDRATADEMDAVFVRHAPQYRPDLIGSLRIWTGPRSVVEVNYFTSEAEARQNESKEPPAELAAHWDEFMAMMSRAEFLDLSEPMLSSA